MKNKIITDTSTLWSIDGIFWKFADLQANECLVNFINNLIDPRNELTCFFQNEKLIDKNQKVPQLYRILLKEGLIKAETSSTAKEYESNLTELFFDEMLDIVDKWIDANPFVAKSFKDLHQNPSVIDEKRYELIAEDGRKDAIPPIVYDYCKSQGLTKIYKISETLNRNDQNWSESDIIFVYSIIIRGMQYEAATNSAYLNKAKYFTHPVRKLSGCNRFKIKSVTEDSNGSPHNINLGKIIAKSWIDSKSDIADIVFWARSVKDKAEKHKNFLDGKITEKEHVNYVLSELLMNIPVKLDKSFFEKIALILKHIPRVGTLLNTILTLSTDKLIQFSMSKKYNKIPIIRKFTNYQELDNNHTTLSCRVCGTLNNNNICPVCGHNKEFIK